MKTTTPTKEESQEKIKVKYFHVVNVKVNKVVLELTKDKKDLVRIRLETDIGNITHKPKVSELMKDSLASFSVEFRQNELIEVTEYIASNPMLVFLSKESIKNPQEIWVSYGELEGVDNNNNPVKYKFMSKGQFENIYYEAFHKDNNANLEKMKSIRDKFSNVEMSINDLGEE